MSVKATNNFNRLSRPLLCSTLALCGPKDLAKALHTCKAFRNCAKDAWTYALMTYTEISEAEKCQKFAHVHHIDSAKDLTVMINKMPRFCSLVLRSFERQEIIDQIFAAQRISALAKLQIIAHHPEVDIRALVRTLPSVCPALTELELSQISVIDADIAGLTKLTRLQKVNFCNSMMTKSSAEMFAQIPSLTSVRFFSCRKIKHDAIDILLDHPHLTELGVSGACGGGGEAQERQKIAKAIAQKGGNLTHLVLSFSDYEDANLTEIVVKCPKLIRLDLTNLTTKTPAVSALAGKLKALKPNLTVVH